MWRKGNPLALLVGMKIDIATMKNCTDKLFIVIKVQIFLKCKFTD